MQKVAEVERSQGGDLRAVVKVQIGTSSCSLSSPFERHLEAMRRDPTLRCSAGTVGACMKLRLVVAVLFKGMLLLVALHCVEQLPVAATHHQSCH